MSQLKLNHVTDAETADFRWKSLYKVGGTTALIVVLVGLMEIFITFLPGGGGTGPGTVTVIDWFTLFQNNWFLGLRNLGLMNIIMTALMVPMFFALYAAHRQVNKAYGALAMILFFLGVAVYIANNTAFPMLTLSGQYAAATTESQKSLLVAAGEAMLAMGQSHSAGTFMGLFFSEVAAIVISIVMLRGRIFSRLTALVGITGFVLLLIFEICSSFVPALFDVAMIFAMSGGLLSMAWHILIARRLFQLGRLEKKITVEKQGATLS